MLPADLFRLPLTTQEEDYLRQKLAHLESENATMGVALKNREAQLNQLNDWLLVHGYGEPDRDTAERTIRALESRLGVRKQSELNLLRRIVDQLARVVQRKMDAGTCMHDVLNFDQFRAISSEIATWRDMQAR